MLGRKMWKAAANCQEAHLVGKWANQVDFGIMLLLVRHSFRLIGHSSFLEAFDLPAQHFGPDCVCFVAAFSYDHVISTSQNTCTNMYCTIEKETPYVNWQVGPPPWAGCSSLFVDCHSVYGAKSKLGLSAGRSNWISGKPVCYNRKA